MDAKSQRILKSPRPPYCGCSGPNTAIGQVFAPSQPKERAGNVRELYEDCVAHSISATLRSRRVDGVRSIVNCDNLTFSACWHKETAMAASGIRHLTLGERRSLFRLNEARVLVAGVARAGECRHSAYPAQPQAGQQPS